jgi:hypothetical protein
MQKRTQGRPPHTDPQRLRAMLHARLTLQKLIARLDATIYNPEQDQRLVARGFDALVEQAIEALTGLQRGDQS